MNMWQTLGRALQGGMLALALAAAPANAQITSVDPDAAIDGDLAGEPYTPPAKPAYDNSTVFTQSAGNGTPQPGTTSGPSSSVDEWTTDSVARAAEAAEPSPSNTYRKDDLIGAAEGVFGKGSEGLAEMIEDLLKKQGEPNAYIVGREGGGAVAIGLRYGSGTLYHKVEGNRPVYWTGPSVGPDLGLNAGKAFVLVYNLHDTQDLYTRFGAGEGQAYLVGGFNVSYLRKNDIVLIPVRMGAGIRLGANLGYMKFSEKQKWLPF